MKLVRKVRPAASYVGVWHVYVPMAGRTLCRRSVFSAYSSTERLSTHEGVNPPPEFACLDCQRRSEEFAELVQR